MSFTYDKQGTIPFLVYEMEPRDTLDTVGLGMIRNNNLHNVLNISFTQVDEKRFLRYNISSKITLQNFFSGMVTKKRLLNIFMGICDAIEDGGAYMLESGLFVLDPQHIYVNVATDEPSLVYLPVLEQVKELDLCKFFKEMMFNAQFDTNENNDYFARIINFLNTSANFSLVDFRQLLTELKNGSTSTAAPINHQPAGNRSQPAPAPISQRPGKIPPPPPPVGARKPAPPAPAFRPPVMEVPKPAPVPTPAPVYEEPPEKKGGLFGFLKKKGPEQPEPGPVPVDLNFEIPGQMPKPAPVAPPIKKEPPAAEPILKTKPAPIQADDGGRSSIPGTAMNMVGGEASLGNMSTGTVVLSTSFPTTVLTGGEQQQAQPKQAVLTRQHTGETVPINKMLMRIGQEASFVDYCITDNPAISHTHADIIRKDDTYWIRDNNSANHTYVNGQLVIGDQEHPLESGDTILLANETFIFELK